MKNQKEIETIKSYITYLQNNGMEDQVSFQQLKIKSLLQEEDNEIEIPRFDIEEYKKMRGTWKMPKRVEYTETEEDKWIEVWAEENKEFELF